MTSTEPKTTQEWRDLKPELETCQTQLALHAEKLIQNARERDWMAGMRDMAIELGIDDVVKDPDIKQYLDAAERRADQGRIYRGGEALVEDEPTFLLDGLIHQGELNFFFGQPKVGKSSFACGLVAAIRDRREQFLGRDLALPEKRMPVLIFGTDQSEGNWQYYLRREGLINDAKVLDSSAIDLFCSVDTKDEFNFSKDGIRHMREEVEKHEAPLVIIDSLSSMMEPLDLQENSNQFSRPIREAGKKLSGTGATLLILHHTKKYPTTWDWITESRGSSGITSIPSWGVLMRYVKDEPEGMVRTDKRVGFMGSGRGHSELGGVQAVYQNEGNWTSLGSLEQAQQIEAVRKKISSLGGVRADVFDYLKMRSELGADVPADEIGLNLKPAKTVSNVSRELDNLVGMGLAFVSRHEPTGHRPKRHWMATDAVLKTNDVAFESPRAANSGFNDSVDFNGIKTITIKESHPQGGIQISKESGFQINDPVELNRKGNWENGFIIVNNADPSLLIAAKKFDLNYRIRNLRPEVDVRPCQPSDPLDI